VPAQHQRRASLERLERGDLILPRRDLSRLPEHVLPLQAPGSHRLWQWSLLRRSSGQLDRGFDRHDRQGRSQEHQSDQRGGAGVEAEGSRAERPDIVSQGGRLVHEGKILGKTMEPLDCFDGMPLNEECLDLGCLGAGRKGAADRRKDYIGMLGRRLVELIHSSFFPFFEGGRFSRSESLHSTDEECR
jgi:hypothetical protein